MPPLPPHDDDHGRQQQQQHQQGQQQQRAAEPGPEASPRQWLKYTLIILSGFLLGVVLGMLSTSLVLYFVPPTWLEHALRHRRARLEEHVRLRSMCGAAGADGFVERYDGGENVVEICTCWAGGVSEVGGWLVSCTRVGLMGYIEQGGWGTEVVSVGG